ncbi:DUF4352 domain-containing protein [Corynebacterium alimapuense]|uniref:DUF4352 domain-containing protein n=1 Tax=Corynebacterium alimapuense TaxID=1576874 RepID=A0A3M8K894_9CORY|nr:DUF4352 domain-containing protein [Corynebacterium alimapuense]RNE48772.1 hypothetical protein C5L39_05545 [Corynebacterium alimapuense]
MNTPQPFDPNAMAAPYPAVEPPKKKKKWPWIVGGIAVVVVATSVFGGDSEEATSTAGNAGFVESDDAVVDAAAEETASATDVGLSETAESDGMMVTVSNARFASSILSDYLCADANLSNQSDSAQGFSQFDFELYKPNGVIANTTFPGLDIKTLEYADLAPGGTTDGAICFDSDGAPGEYKIEYSGGLFADPLTWSFTL